jgi:uncharacterized protein (UPF0335 family)
LNALLQDQPRLREDFKALPQTSEQYKRFLEKFDKQETEVEKLRAKVKDLRTDEKGKQKEYEAYIMGLNVG